MTVVPLKRARPVDRRAGESGRQQGPAELRLVGGTAAGRRRDLRPLGQILLETGAVQPGDLVKALALHKRQDLRLGQILIARGWVSEPALMRALSLQWGAPTVGFAQDRSDPRLLDRLGAEFCLANGILPWRRIAGTTVIATSRPEEFAGLRARLPASAGPYSMVLAGETQIHAEILSNRQSALIRRAETCVALDMSCRKRDGEGVSRQLLIGLAALAAALWFLPLAVFAVIAGWAALTLVAAMGLKAAAFAAEVRADAAARRAPMPVLQPKKGKMRRLPMVSIMLPLFHERDIAGRLLKRISRLDYPRELLDVLLVIEEDDRMTRAALAETRLPEWVRVVVVPDGPVRTKPRALNFALSFCRGQIIGIYDAEDAPEPRQIHTIAARFAEAPADVACLQGILDFYNPRTNWLSRCFTVEYCSWFRVILPGIARLGFVVPLGGTTLFFRRETLEKLGAWDAWNVTEDADLGVRIARMGYRTELVRTVTEEEPNCRVLPWIKQRSRWLKGYAMTWAVHMRDPVGLWRDLGPKRFIGFQIMFLGALSQYLLAPVLWSFWLLGFGAPHPAESLLSTGALIALIAAFIFSEALNIAVGLWAVRGPRHRHLWAWVPSLHFYHPLGTLAGWKAIYETVTMPFYWDKTAHGIFDAPGTGTEAPAPEGAALPGARPTAELAAAMPARRVALIEVPSAARPHDPAASFAEAHSAAAQAVPTAMAASEP